MPQSPITFRPMSNDTPQKAVVLLLSTGGVCEFSTLETAQTYLSSALSIDAPGASDAALFSYDFERKEWQRVV